jgi:hypothetical protein
MYRLIPLLLLVSCSRPLEPTCVTACGLQWLDPLTDQECLDLRKFELEALLAFEKHVVARGDWRVNKACAALQSWRANVHPDSNGHYWMHNKVPVAGVTYCWTHGVSIAHTNWRSSALMHELAHVVQHCDAGGDDDHYNWSSIYQAIDEMRSTPMFVSPLVGEPGCAVVHEETEPEHL